ncbi:PspC domain-containing protein [Paeniglutamicibacter sp. ABSL32-1]|uniref:PspC domain-containing protein n=1 Tax=Paeniglutamicibacter quisquiliarum TaxID=2849498 RepID=UPI001C2D74FF|nr:PspC domain-containing protein [Paeniglutamicibacter quisquiliarum]MBV1779909.1 PspC domain-containing protein [Paeniglutamicibacter quisquiliarum]
MREASMEHGFFRWVRELGLQRGEDHWVGGVASGVAQRFGISPILVRGAFVALCFVAGLGLLVYGVGWALMPGPDGKIHVQEAIAGRWSSGMSGAVVFTVVGAVSSPALFGWWDGGFWTLLVIAGIAFLVFSRRGSFAGGTQPLRTPTPAGPADFQSATPPSTAAHSPAPGTAGPTPVVSANTVILPGTVHEGPEPRGAAGNADEPGNSGDPDDPASTNKPAEAADPAGTGAPTTPLPGTRPGTGPNPQEHTMPLLSPEAPAFPGRATGPGNQPPAAGFGPPPTAPLPGSAAPWPGKSPKPVRHKALPGYAATIVLGLAVLLFALVTGLSHLGLLELPADAVAVGFAVALIVIALGLIGAALNQRTGGALVGFGIVALIFSLLWGGGSLRDSGPMNGFMGITSTDGDGTTNVFNSGELDLRSYSTITSDTTVKLDNVFSSMELTVPDNIPVVIDSQGAFGSMQVNGANTGIRDGETVLNADRGGPELRLEIDGAFSSIQINVEKAEVAP